MSVAVATAPRPSGIARIVADCGSAAHAYVGVVQRMDGAAASRSIADAVHHLCLVHGRHPGVVDHAAARVTDAEPRRTMFAIADAFAQERDLLARLVVAVGPIPSTPGQAETEASVLAQRHAIDMLAQSDRVGCSAGAALALVLDWHMIRPVLTTAARRFGIEVAASSLPDQATINDLATTLAVSASAERAMAFGAQQIADQHHGLWDLLEARAKARAAD